MKAVINGKVYNTETAEKVCELPCRHNRGDFGWHDTYLYRTKKGAFFLAGTGGASSMWSQSVSNGSVGGSGVRPVTDDEAREWMEHAGCSEDEFKKVGLDIEEA